MLRLSCVLFCILCSSFVQSKQVSVNVLNASEDRVGNVVVYLTPENPLPAKEINEVAIMDQVNTQFAPHILAVQKNTQVRFPNSDSIKHHVYSFSPANTFELQLYKELQADPLLFSKSGSVELGCNIHDWMLGYIFVVDTPYFGKTNAQGEVTLEVPEGRYQLDIWHPRIQDDTSVLSQQVSVAENQTFEVKLKTDMLPDVNQYEEASDGLSDYE